MTPDIPNGNEDLLTQMLQSFLGGSRAHAEELERIIGPTLRTIAAGVMRGERSDAWIRRTELIHEVWLRLCSGGVKVKNRTHFWCLAARIMRHHLVDMARKRNSEKRGGDVLIVPFNEFMPGGDGHLTGGRIDVVRVDDLLNELEAEKPDAVRMIELRCFLGLRWDEIVETTGLSLRQARRRYEFGLKRLRKKLS